MPGLERRHPATAYRVTGVFPVIRCKCLRSPIGHALMLLALLLPMAARAAELHRGINLTNWFRFPARGDAAALGAYLGDAALAELRKTGFDFVRLAVDPGVVAAVEQRDALIAAIRRIERQGLAVVVGPHPHDWRLESREADRNALRQFWRVLAPALRGLDPARTMPEVLNEPVFPGDAAGWAALQHALLRTIRQSLPDVTVVLTGADWGSIDGLLRLPPEDDPKLVYSFHFYDPVELTSLAAWRHDVDRAALARLAFPVGDDCHAPVGTDAATRGVIRFYCARHWDANSITAAIGRAAAWARAHGVRLLAGEFGATVEQAAGSRLRWIEAVRAACDAEGIAWALWGLEDSMGFNLPRPPPARLSLDGGLLAALGLHAPM